MRNLDAINPKGMRPSRFISICACLPVMLSLICLPLAYGAAPDVPLDENPVSQLLFLMMLSALVPTVASWIFSWGWDVRYYGISLIFGIGISLLAIVPFLVFMIYGESPLWAKITVFSFYVSSHVVWCRKIVVLYGDVFKNKALRGIVYEEDSGAVYYMRRGDQYLLRKYYKFSQAPRDRYFVSFVAIALALVPVAGSVRQFTGVPFAHVFLLVAMLPVSWMSFGFAVRGFLVCYSYPAKIKKSTGKNVYVDMGSMHRRVDKKNLA